VTRQQLPRHWTEIRRDWEELSAHERFETCVAYLLTVVIAAVVVIALSRLIVSVVDTLILKALNPLDHAVFQVVFGEIMTLLIALEFNHTLRYTIGGARGIIQTRVVILIALLALTRKVIVMDLFEASPAQVGGLAALALSLGAAYWLVNGPRRSPSTGMEVVP
jgi:uncharacterized membrane protein (DUF373 family)